MILFLACSQIRKGNTFFQCAWTDTPPTPGEKELERGKRNTGRLRSKVEKTKRLRVCVCVREGERERGGNPCCSAIFGALKTCRVKWNPNVHTSKHTSAKYTRAKF